MERTSRQKSLQRIYCSPFTNNSRVGASHDALNFLRGLVPTFFPGCWTEQSSLATKYVRSKQKVTRVGFEPTPFRNRALICRLRPLGHPVTRSHLCAEQSSTLRKERNSPRKKGRHTAAAGTKRKESSQKEKMSLRSQDSQPPLWLSGRAQT